MALIQPSSFWRKANPRGAIADFRSVYEQAGPNRWRIGVVSAAATIGIFSVMFQEEQRGIPHPPRITYVSTLEAGRSDKQIIAENKANQILKDRYNALQAKRDEEVREIYRKVGRMSGMDVDAIEKRAAAERAAEESAKAAASMSRPGPSQ